MNQISRAGKGVAPCWTGVNEVTPQTVPDPRLVDPEDVVVRRRRDVRLRPALLGGHIPFMRKGDVLGHEFVGEVVEIGPQVRKHRGGNRLEAVGMKARSNRPDHVYD